MHESFDPGQTIRCTVTEAPRTDDRRQTIARLMRRDPEIKRGLRRSQKRRTQTMDAYIRGGRTWYNRERASRLAHPVEGNSWTMRFTPDVVPDLRSVEPYVKIEKA